ncbi:MAG: hypothetical protein Q9157_006086 [Trypethelium eluteriae]
MITTAAAATAALVGTSALAAYADAKFHVSQDVGQLQQRRRAEKWYIENASKNRLSLWYPFCNNVTKFPNDPCIWSREGELTWQEVHDRAARYAQYFIAKGVKPGELVAFYLQNSADFVVIWLALFCIGCAPAMINFNLKGNSLIHCLRLSRSKTLLVDEDEACQERVKECRTVIEGELGMNITVLGAEIKAKATAMPVTVPDDSWRESVNGASPSALLYTSGTTGLPKAAIMPVQRIWALGNQKKPSFGQVPGPGGDRWYSCMPMFHGTGGLTMVANLMGGLSLAIGKRFSVSTFWDDIHDSECTIFVYVGEAARYLLNAPHHPRERDHPRLRIMYGNGLRPDVWERFRDRFDVPEIAEFFNSTEGLFQLLNYNRGDFTAGAVGHQGALMRRLVQNVFIPVQVDAETGDVYRDSTTGLAKRMSYEDGGEILVAIPSERAFGGYFNDDKATSKKILHDVFRKGDIFYRTGDALRRDGDGRWYFIDRLGDTFRWKSENVSTAEVAETLGRYSGVAEANVYGVTVPKHDGRAGCVALSLSVRREDFDFDGFFGHARANLPRYAVPVFLRLVAKESSTDNNKQNKVPLREEGIDLDILGSKVIGGEYDVLLWHPGGYGYVKFEKSDLEKLRSGELTI